MPIYEYKCQSCGKISDHFFSIEGRLPLVSCKCGGVAVRIISAPAVRGDYEAYQCPVTGKTIEGRKAHEENLKRQGCRVYESGEKEEMLSRKKADEASFDRQLDADVDKFVATLPTKQREQFVNEVSAGVTAEVVRN